MRRLLEIGLLALGTALLVPAALPADQPRAAELKKLHILMVFDTQASDLERSVKIDERRMRSFWKYTIPASRYQLTVLTGDKVSRTSILNYYKNLKVGPTDGLVFVYGGHAAKDKNTGKHYFDLAGQKVLYRTDLVKGMESTKAGLVVLLTDCCSTPREAPFGDDAPPEDMVAARSITAASRVATKIHPTVRNLFFQARGTVDITAATDNASWSDVRFGGLFTRSVCTMLCLPIKEVDKNGDGVVTWAECFPQLQKGTDSLFRVWRGQMISRGESIPDRNQKPHAFSLGLQAAAAASGRQAVLSIENATSAVLRYRWRWSDQDAWTEVELKKGQKQLHTVEVSDGTTLPKFEAKFPGLTDPKVLDAQEFRGEGQPTSANGKYYRVRVAPDQSRGS
jgi:hypothetical protein